MAEFQAVDSVGVAADPKLKFSVLLLKAGFGRWELNFHDTWKKVMAFSPFDQDVSFNIQFDRKQFVAYSDDVPLDIAFQTSGGQLVVPQAQQSAVLDRLAASTVAGGIPARTIWESAGRFGDYGSLVVVLVKGNAPAEFYQLSPSPSCPMPFVAVVVNGDDYHQVIVRAMAQAWALLGDEYELPDNDFLASNLVHYDHRRPNVILLDAGQRTKLQAGQKFLSVVDSIADGWNISGTTSLKFNAHPNNGVTPDDTYRAASGQTQLVEGAAGYRLNAFRSDFDCLMRRKPYSTTLPIQDKRARFCNVCSEILRARIVANRNHDRSQRRVLLDSQRPLVDTIFWQKVDKSKAAIGTQVALNVVGSRGAKWEYSYRLDAELGLKISGVKLHDLNGILFGPVMDIFDHIGFNGLAVKFANESEHALSIADAFANKTTPPVFEDLQSAFDKIYLRGHRLSLTWAIPGHWDIEAVMSIVLRDVVNDFDPGGAVDAVKCYPQLSLRYRRPAGVKSPGTLAKVEYLQGTIELMPVNVIPTNLMSSLPGHWMHMATGKQTAALFTDSNSAGWDSDWDETKHQVAEFASDIIDEAKDLFGYDPGHAPIDFGLWTADWKSGRLLQGVDMGSLSSPASLGPPTARHGNVNLGLPTLPYWSWLFDYVQSNVTGTREFVGCYSTSTADAALAGGKPNQVRDLLSEWPPIADVMYLPGLTYAHGPFTRTVRKLPRQGAFDNIHVHPDMGLDDQGRTIVAAPFCGDLCFHLHWRWGIVSLTGSKAASNFMGWGNGRLDQGAHTVRGTPLIPPNQHLKVQLQKQTSSTLIAYCVRADNPDYDAYQVFLEQGGGLAFNYQGLRPMEIALLGTAMGEIDVGDYAKKIVEFSNLARTNPKSFDEQTRTLFHLLYPKYRFYVENGLIPNIQQAPESGGTQTTLEDF
ncbi:MAG: hypothetical protein ABI605_12435 [Rhizobacter sp.]